jgi:hypothetical protein
MYEKASFNQTIASSLIPLIDRKSDILAKDRTNRKQKYTFRLVLCRLPIGDVQETLLVGVINKAVCVQFIRDDSNIRRKLCEVPEQTVV